MQKLRDGMLLYHGSYMVVDTPDLAKCAARKDFGKGFYLTSSRKQAEDFVRASLKKAIAQGLITEDQNFGFVSVFEYHEKDGVSKFVYENADADWLHCIVGHRKKNTFSIESPGATIGQTLSSLSITHSIITGSLSVSASSNAALNSSFVVAL